MNNPRTPWLISGLLLTASCAGPTFAGADDPPPLEGPAELMQDDGQVVAPVTGPAHEAFSEGGPTRVGAPNRVRHAPPAPIAERPRNERPGPDAQWLEGYWAWDSARQEYVWAAGVWRIPPAGKFWVDGRWRRDEGGWYRIPGSWSDRRTDRIDWRQAGPPADRPETNLGAPPGPDFFQVTGHYVPDGDGLTWRAGFWAKAQPGWEWVPARWVRFASGWDYREGHWERSLNGRVVPDGPASPFRNRVLVSEPLHPAMNPGTDPGPLSSRRDAARPAYDATDLLPPRDEASAPPVDAANGTAGSSPSPRQAPGEDLATEGRAGPVKPDAESNSPEGADRSDPPAPPPAAMYPPTYPPPGAWPFGPGGRPDPRLGSRTFRRGPLAPVRSILRDVLRGPRR